MKKKKLNFGCGKDIRKGYYNVDILKEDGIDQSFDFEEFPYPIDDNSFDEIECRSVLEHCHYPKKVLAELWRISRPNGIIKIRLPHVNSMSAYSILDHCSYFSRWSFVFLDETYQWDKEKFITIENNVKHQRYLKLIPTSILNLMSVFLTNIFVQIDAKLKVIK